MSGGLVAAFAAVGAAVGAVLWFCSGLLISAATWTSTQWRAAVALVVPPTVPVGTWQRLPPWNLALPGLGALLFGGLLGLGLWRLLVWRHWQASAWGVRLLSVWIVSIGAAFITAAIWAFGSTIANATSNGLGWAFRSAQPDLLASGYFGVVWGWTPALTVILLETRLQHHHSRARHTAVISGSAPPVGIPGSTPGWKHSSLPLALALVVFLIVGSAVGVVFAQPVAVRAERIASGDTLDGLPTPTPPPARRAVSAPLPVAPQPVQPGPHWCVPDTMGLTVSAPDSALGHRDIALVLTNRASAPCVVDGYPDVAFTGADGHTVDVQVEHGSSYTATDPGATEILLAPGTFLEAHLSWNATSAGTGTVRMLWAASYPGAQRTRLAVDTDIIDGSTVSVTAWAR